MVLASAREAQKHVTSGNHDNISARSAPPSVAKEATSSSRNSNKHSDLSQSATSKGKNTENPKSKAERKEKREHAKLERKDSVTMQKPVRSVTNLNGNVIPPDSVALNGKLVDTYHIPDATQHVQEGFRGGKLQHEGEIVNSKVPRGSKIENGSSKTELHYSSVTDLSQTQWYQLNGGVSGGKAIRKKGVGSVPVPRSASSSSSKEELEPRSDSTTLSGYDRERSEVGMCRNTEIPNFTLVLKFIQVNFLVDYFSSFSYLV